MEKSKEILVVCDEAPYDVAAILQITTKANQILQNKNGRVCVVCIGAYQKEQFQTLYEYGAYEICFYKADEDVTIRTSCNIVEHIIRQKKPELVLFPASTRGKAMAAILATRLDAGLTADCIDIEIENEKIAFYRSAVSDTVIAKIICIHTDLAMATIKKDVFLEERKSGIISSDIRDYSDTEIIKVEEEFEVINSKPLQVEPEVDLDQYQVLFCIGRGVKTKETLEHIRSLATACKAGLIGTRAAVDEGLIEKSYQVGQSGKSVKPRIYIGFGVSGTCQHMVGIKNAGLIISINQDENAPIFDYSDYAVVDDIDHALTKMEEIIHQNTITMVK